MSIFRASVDSASPDAFIREVAHIMDIDEEEGVWESFFTRLFECLWVDAWVEEDSSAFFHRYQVSLRSTPLRGIFLKTQDLRFPKTWSVQLEPVESRIRFLGSSLPRLSGNLLHSVSWDWGTRCWRWEVDQRPLSFLEKVRRLGHRTLEKLELVADS